MNWMSSVNPYRRVSIKILILFSKKSQKSEQHAQHFIPIAQQLKFDQLAGIIFGILSVHIDGQHCPRKSKQSPFHIVPQLFKID
ncbi:hypothetical protein BpHYR1_015574 [Brachionus plicatilis]|uniref:Uncharacterized protein n=1 Tax=Brachionus plicatilis TaxID=10195 RepID=A0A3M7S549_BRAPC|nr:hypothetical protein BpHYR1_015574 [Brachionus plicatilis]